ncbi:MAG: hypothetical protein AAFO07_18500 [Bacteroidota bacterium]
MKYTFLLLMASQTTPLSPTNDLNSLFIWLGVIAWSLALLLIIWIIKLVRTIDNDIALENEIMKDLINEWEKS